MWHAVYRTDTRELISVGTVVADPLPDGFSSVDVGNARPAGTWNPTTLAFDPMPAAPRNVTVVAFLRRFTQQERINFRIAAESNRVIQDYMDMLRRVQFQEINLDDLDIQAGLLAGEQAGLLEYPGRAAEILA